MYLFIYVHYISKKIFNFTAPEITDVHYKPESTKVCATISTPR